MNKLLEKEIFNATSQSFERTTLDVFRFQAEQNGVYKQYLKLLNVNPESITNVFDIPFLPISFFKTHNVYTHAQTPEKTFSSSGTTGAQISKHPVASLPLYRKSFLKGFELAYGSPKKYCFLALLPSYLEREGSSLVYMVDALINESQLPLSGFFLNNYDELIETLQILEQSRQPTILIGVTFALLKLAKEHAIKFDSTIVMETGGMKGRGKELVREELHSLLMHAFGVKAIHSEYGMTELLSQAYSKGNGVFVTPPWMRVVARDPYDPLTVIPNDGSGALNIIDLANLYSCSFIQTDDLGVINPDGTFEVTGRMDGSQIRGCNLLV
ncbi:MAG: acyltransferase [Bacteroidales bacterium]